MFSTKDREPLIKPEFEIELYNHIKEKLENDFECKVMIINGMSEHVHQLFLLSPKFSVETIFKNLKGESSHWINQSSFIKQKFAWQTGYGAFSVSESMVNEVEKYIFGQKEHHRKLSFDQEVELLIKKYNLKTLNR
ncbi:MAG: IS200/IS605 family transposase [Ignavibacterium sp.]|nr:IS200/IS605 family transposase [Ignavibacterium sp.]